MEIKKKLVTDARIIAAVTAGKGNGKDFITVHETGNINEGADAEAHANLQTRGNNRTAAWHYSVDDREIWQSWTHDYRCYAGGDGRGNGNYNSIHIEICVNKDGDYKKACANAAWLVAKIMKEEKIPLANVVQHNRWSGKNCPTQMRAGQKGVTWSSFLKDVEEAGKEKKAEVKVDKNAKTYKVVKGDTFSEIAEKFGITVAEIQAWNPGVKPEALQIGQVINVKKPAAPKAEPKKEAAKPAAKPAPKPVAKPVVKVDKKKELVKRLQKEIKVTADGVFGPKTKAACPTVKEGHGKVSMVKIVQDGLNYHGAKLKVDGVFGNGTEAAVKKFQKDKKLKADGIVGPATFEKMFK